MSAWHTTDLLLMLFVAHVPAASGIPNLVQAMHLSDETPPEAQQGDEEDEEQKGEAS
jgi:hypothetical protein